MWCYDRICLNMCPHRARKTWVQWPAGDDWWKVVVSGLYHSFRFSLIIIITTEATDKLSCPKWLSSWILEKILLYILWHLVIYSYLALARSPLIPTWDPAVACNLLLHSHHSSRVFTFCVKWACRHNTTCHQHKQPAINKNKLKTVSHH